MWKWFAEKVEGAFFRLVHENVVRNNLFSCADFERPTYSEFIDMYFVSRVTDRNVVIPQKKCRKRLLMIINFPSILFVLVAGLSINSISHSNPMHKIHAD